MKEVSERFIRKYMRLAKQFGEDDNACYSRQIGSVIVDPEINSIVSMGYNSPPADTPHCDSREYLENIFWEKLSLGEKRIAANRETFDYWSDNEAKEEFLKRAVGCKVCPRKLIRALSGERLELCSCAHSEANALIKADRNVKGCWLFCWCPLPCFECAKLIINKKISTVVCLQTSEGDYSKGSRELFKFAKVNVVEHPEEYYKCTE
jgi:deoxycytidylate deaminase